MLGLTLEFGLTFLKKKKIQTALFVLTIYTVNSTRTQINLLQHVGSVTAAVSMRGTGCNICLYMLYSKSKLTPHSIYSNYEINPLINWLLWFFIGLLPRWLNKTPMEEKIGPEWLTIPTLFRCNYLHFLLKKYKIELIIYSTCIK